MVMPILDFDATAIETIAFRFKDDDESIKANCNGSISAETETTTKSKTCGGQTVKEITKPTKINLTVEAHLPVEILRRVMGLKQDEKIKKGVYSYGKGSRGEQFGLSAELVDEFEGNSKLIAFLRVASTAGLTFTIDSTEDEISMFELTATVYEDDLGYWYHEVMEDELPAGLTKDKWLTSLTAEDLQARPAVK